ncbi:isomerase [Armatimonadota bacterium]|nr:isomerase [Armatimonadota bacterium]
MGIPLFQVDAFTDKPFSGNPAAVCLLSEPLSDAFQQSLAMENNLAETAYLLKEGDCYRLRWFTPLIEVDLCGHATLASAHVLWETGTLAPTEQARFQTRSGVLSATRSGDWITLNFPALSVEPTEIPQGLTDALGAEPLAVYKSRYDLLIHFESEESVHELTPNFQALGQIPARGFIVTAKAGGGDFDFVSRFFAPAVGIDEDPVTGSAHCALTPFWADRLGKSEFVAYQASKRGGVLRLKLEGERVLLTGQAVTILKGEVCL